MRDIFSCSAVTVLTFINDGHTNNRQHQLDIICLPYVTSVCALQPTCHRVNSGTGKNDNELEISGMKYGTWLIVRRLDFLFPWRKIISGTYSTCHSRQVLRKGGWWVQHGRKGSSKQKEARVEVLATAVNRLSTGSADQPNPNFRIPLLQAVSSLVYAMSYFLPVSFLFLLFWLSLKPLWRCFCR